MTTIDKLGIKGIRSYGDDETLIKFFKPLTIFLGRNGSGKSTIIESVKMATTGDPPPLSSGAAFIHDPRIENETETKAKIRLMFTDVSGDQYIVKRNFRLSLKKHARAATGYTPMFSSLNHAFCKLDNENGNTNKDFREKDLRALLPDHLRVSKPVLTNVIFVHQEDSLWPLSQPATLKKNFDEIFAATKYTQALEVIRKFRKDQAGEMKAVNVELMHFEEKVKRLEAVRRDVDEIQVRYDELRRGVAKLANEIAALEHECESTQLLSNEYAQLGLELEKLRTEASVLGKAKAEKYSELQLHLAGVSPDDIRQQIEQLQTSLDNSEEESARKSRLIQELSRDIEMKRDESIARQNRKGMLVQQAKTQKERLDKLERMKQEVLLSKDHCEQLSTTDAPLRLPSASDTTERWTQALNDLQRDAEAYVKKLTDDCKSTEDVASENCTNVKLRLEAAKAAVAMKRKSAEDNRKELKEKRRELRDLEQSQVSVKDAEGRMKALQTAIREKEQSGQISAFERKISEQNEKKSSTKKDLSDARRVRDLLHQDQEEQTKLEVARRGVRATQIQLKGGLEELLELQISAIRDLAELDADPDALETIRSQLLSCGPVTDDNVRDKQIILDEIGAKILAKRDLLVEKTQYDHSKLQTELESAKSQKLTAEQTWTSFRSEIHETKSEIQSVIKRLQTLQDPPEEVRALLLSASETLAAPVDSQSFGNEWFVDAKKARDAIQIAMSRAKQKLSQQETGLILAEGDLEQFEEHPKHMCPACGLVSSKKVDQMRANLRSRVENCKDPERLIASKKSLETLEKSVEVVKRLDALTLSAKELNPKLTNASVDKTNASQKFKEAKRAFTRSEGALSKAKQLTADGNTQQVLVKRLELKQVLKSLARDQQDLDAQQNSLSVSRTDDRSLADVDKQIRQLEEDLNTVQETLDRTEKCLKDETSDLKRLEVRFHQAKTTCLEQEAKSQRQRALGAETEKLNNTLRSIEEEIEVHKTSNTALQSELEEAEDELRRTRGENMMLIEHASAKLSKRRQAAQSWADCEGDIHAYLQSGKEKELQTLQRSLDVISSEVASKTAELRKHERDQRTVADSRKEIDSNLRNLRENQKYILLEQELQTNDRSMRHIEDKLAEIERKAGEKPAEKVKRLTEQINDKNKDRSATLGTQHGIAEMYKKKRKELTEAEKEGSRRKFDECRIKKQTMQLASGDLDRYHKALDQALMAFHTLKMNSINRTIKELWQEIYCGEDIEEIEITSDHGDGRGGATKRNFNYRVQMRQGGAILDMRGRCSSGQKVLACLVIRLALAENFCADCGILALDEPTTNLDSKNIMSLAEALKKIIGLRRNQRNFQLILITHDQEFIEKLGAREICHQYYRVYKDDSGLSRAKLQDLQMLL